MSCVSRIRTITSSVSVLAMAAAGMALTAMPPAASADSFYKGKTIKVIIRSAPGGGNDFYGRLLGRHMPKHIPGKPEVLPQNMPGAGGIVATNYIANRAKRDGTEIGILPRDLPITQRVGATGVKFDVRTMVPIGSAASSVAVYALAAKHPVDSLSELKTFGKTVKFSATGRGSGSFQRPTLLALDGFPTEVISGYSGTDERLLAIARGEVQGTSSSYGSLKQAVKDGEIKVIGRLGKHPDLKDAETPRQVLSKKLKPLASLLTAPLVAGRPFFTAPGVPKDRVQILRAAFKKALHDPALLKEAERAKRPIAWTSAEEIQEVYAEILDADDDVVAQFKKLM